MMIKFKLVPLSLDKILPQFKLKDEIDLNMSEKKWMAAARNQAQLEEDCIYPCSTHQLHSLKMIAISTDSDTDWKICIHPTYRLK